MSLKNKNYNNKLKNKKNNYLNKFNMIYENNYHNFFFINLISY